MKLKDKSVFVFSRGSGKSLRMSSLVCVAKTLSVILLAPLWKAQGESDFNQIVSTYGVQLSVALGALVPLGFSCGFCGELEQHLGNSLLTRCW